MARPLIRLESGGKSMRHLTFATISISLLLCATMPAHAQEFCDEQTPVEQVTTDPCDEAVAQPTPAPAPDPLALRILRYAEVALKHRMSGLASYYSTSLDGTLTSTGEIFRNRRFTAAHLTLPLGTWVEIKARATGRIIRCRVNDRGPYVKKFAIDLSQAAARALGVDVAEDRHVDIRIIALPGEAPLPRAANETLASLR